MKTKTIFKLMTLLFVAVTISCSDENSDDMDGNNNNNNTGNTNDISITVDEYPSSGTFLSSISSSLEGTLSYEINNLTSGLALIITNEQLAVGDWLAFDYETNQVLEAQITISNGTETEVIDVTVTINNVDDIWAFLSGDTRTAYENASPGEWVWIRESEYNDLANYLASTTKSGTSDNQLFSNVNTTNSTAGRTISNDNGFSIPSGDYVFAFKYYSWTNNVSGSRVKISEDDASGAFQYLGEMLPQHNDEFNHFVLKGANSPTAAQGYIGMYATGGPGVKPISGSTYKWRNGDVENLDNTAGNSVYLYQGLSTSLKQWD
ncbi:MAG: hypothetical protein ACWA5P_03400 [bacterium]